MILPDHDINARASTPMPISPPLIVPYNERQLQPASYDVLLDKKVLVPTNPFAGLRGTIDLKGSLPDDLYEEVDISDGLYLYPQKFILASTVERVSIPADMVGRIEGKSSRGRIGLTAHITAGYLDPGFCGNVTLEILNVFPRPIRLWPRVRIAQLSFEYLASECERPYGSPGLGSHYQDSSGPIPPSHANTV